MNAVAVVAFLSFLVIVNTGGHVEAQRAPPRIALSATLSPSYNTTWQSPNGTFALGFFPVASDNYVLGIWYGGLSVPLTVVWMANRQDPVDRNALLRFNGGNLVLYDARGEAAWQTGTGQGGVVGAELRDSGNLVLLNSTNGSVWESFNYPTDTLLPGQSLRRKMALRSWRSLDQLLAGPNGTFAVDPVPSPTPNFGVYNSSQSVGYGDPSEGLYSAGFRSNGTFGLVWNSSVTYVSTYEASGNDTTSIDGNLYLNVTRGSRLLPSYATLDDSGKFTMFDKNDREVYSWQATDASRTSQILRRMTLDDDGNFRMYSWSPGSGTRPGSWNVVWEAVQDPCSIYGVCGLNGRCQSSANSTPVCSCPFGFDADSFSRDSPCRSRFPVDSCADGVLAPVLENVRLLGAGGSFSSFTTTSFDTCAEACSTNCSCRGLMYVPGESTCLLYDSQYLAVSDSPASSVSLKVNQLELQPPSPSPSPYYPAPWAVPPSSSSKKSDTWKVAAIAIGASAAVVALVILVVCWCCWVKKKKKKSKVVSSESKAATPQSVARSGHGGLVSAKPWTYKELRRATKSFDQPLGDGRFGPLFKGVLPDGTVVAVRILRKPVPVDPEGEAQLYEVVRASHEIDSVGSGARLPTTSEDGGAVLRSQPSLGAILALKRSEDEKVLLPREISRSSSQDGNYAPMPPKAPSSKASRFRSRSLGLARQISASVGLGSATPGFAPNGSIRGGGAHPGFELDSDESREFPNAVGKNPTGRSGGFGSFFSGRSIQSMSWGPRYARSGELTGTGRASNKMPYSGELRQSQEIGLGAILSRNASARLPPDSILFESTVFHSQEEQQFRAMVEELGRVNHVNLVRLVGFCIEGRRRLLVYNFVENGSIAKFLFQRKSYNLMDWPTRYDIALGAANGIAHLHEQCSPTIIHGDIRPESIVLDGQFKARVTDFGLLQLILGNDKERIISYMQGRHPYLAPEWAAGLPITPKVDVYSFGLVLLEIVGGRRSFEPSTKGEQWNFPSWAFQQMEASNFQVLADDNLNALFDEEQLIRVVRTAFWCLQDEAEMRPSMAVVLMMLDGQARIPLPVPPPRLIQGLSVESVPNNLPADKTRLGASVESDGEEALEGCYEN